MDEPAVDRLAPRGVTGPGPDAVLAAALLGVSGLTSALSDELDQLGLRGAIPASAAPPLQPGGRVIGTALTLRYLPERLTAGRLRADGSSGHLGNAALAAAAHPGNIAVIDGRGVADVSFFGGMAAKDALDAGVRAVLIDGAVRDVDEIAALGLPVWATARTPTTGRRRVEAVELNGWVAFRDVQVRPGDIVVADDNGICFIPPDAFTAIAKAVLVAAGE